MSFFVKIFRYLIGLNKVCNFGVITHRSAYKDMLAITEALHEIVAAVVWGTVEKFVSRESLWRLKKFLKGNFDKTNFYPKVFVFLG